MNDFRGKEPKEKAGVIVYRRHSSAEPEVLVVSSRRHPGSWVFPVGSVEAGETAAAAAERECAEEAGFTVVLGPRLGTFAVAGPKGTALHTYFLATAAGELRQWEQDRQRRWIPLSGLVDTVADVFHDAARQAQQHIRRLVCA